MYCKKPQEVRQGEDSSSKEERERRSRSEMGVMEGEGWVVQEENGQGREEQRSRRSERSATQREEWVIDDVRSSSSGVNSVVQWGKLRTTKPRTSCLQEELAPVQRSTTSSPGVSSSSRQASSGRRQDELKVEMDVTMSLRNGRHITTKYRVSGQAAMQCVIIKVGQLLSSDAASLSKYDQSI